MQFSNLSWLEILSRTISAIHASPGYQQYMKRKRLRVLRESYGLEGRGGRQLNRQLGENESMDCLDCGVFLKRRSNSKLCPRCFYKCVKSLLGSGQSIEQIAARMNIREVSLVNYFSKTKTAKKKLIVSANKIADESFARPRHVTNSRAMILSVG